MRSVSLFLSFYSFWFSLLQLSHNPWLLCSFFSFFQSLRSLLIYPLAQRFFPQSWAILREPPWEIPPMQRSCGEDLTGKDGSGFEGLPRPAWASTPKPASVCLTILCLSPTLLTLTGGYPRPPFSGENQPRALANKSPGHERNISNQTPSVSILACLAGLSRLLQLRIWLFTASQLWEAWED